METVIRVAYVYILLMVVLRIMGKRELGRLSPFELVLLMLIPELFSQALVREDFSMTNATVASGQRSPSRKISNVMVSPVSLVRH